MGANNVDRFLHVSAASDDVFDDDEFFARRNLKTVPAGFPVGSRLVNRKWFGDKNRTSLNHENDFASPLKQARQTITVSIAASSQVRLVVVQRPRYFLGPTVPPHVSFVSFFKMPIRPVPVVVAL